MAWSVLNTDKAGTGGLVTTFNHTLSFTPADGSKLIVIIFDDSSISRSVSTVTDQSGGAGNAFGQVIHFTSAIGSGNEFTDVWVLDHPHYAAAPTISITIGGGLSATFFALYLEVSGLATGQTSAILDGTAGTQTQTGTSTSAPDPAYSSTAVNEFLVDILGDQFDSGGAGTYTAPTGYTSSIKYENTTDGSGGVAWKNSTGGSEAGSQWTWASASLSVNVVKVAFKLPAAPAAPVVPPAPVPASIFLQQMQLEGVLYKPPITLNVEHIASDYLYLTDTVARGTFTPSRSVSDVLGFADSATPGHQNPRSISDTLGLSDTVARTINFPRTNTETLGLTDSTVANVTVSRSTADVLGLADTVVIAEQAAFQSQVPQPPVQFLLANLGLPFPGSPTIYIAQVLSSSISDNLGLADTAAANVTVARSTSDTLGLTDSVAVVAPFVNPPTPPIPPIIILRQYSLEAFLTQPVPPTNPNVVLVTNVTDQLGLTNTTTANVTVARSVSENLGLTDTVTAGATTGRSDADTLGLADTVTAQLAAVRTVSDLLGLIDAASRQAMIGRGVSERLGLTDTASGPAPPASTGNLFLDLNTGDLVIRI